MSDPKPKKVVLENLFARLASDATRAPSHVPAAGPSMQAARQGMLAIPRKPIPQDAPHPTDVPANLAQLGDRAAEIAALHPATMPAAGAYMAIRAAIQGDPLKGALAAPLMLAHAPGAPAAADEAATAIRRGLARTERWSQPHAEEFARIFESLPARDPAAEPYFRRMASEVDQQFAQMKKEGIRVEFTTTDPYRTSKEMMADVRDNKRLKVFKTPEDHGHPFLSAAENDKFRAVHDYFGHFKEGNSFSALGEENAYRAHSQMFSPEAARAMATETRGQNSWFNAGPHAKLPASERPFAQQKGALWPEEHMGDYVGDPHKAKMEALYAKQRAESSMDPAQAAQERTQKLLDDLRRAGWSGMDRRTSMQDPAAFGPMPERRAPTGPVIKASELPQGQREGGFGEMLQRIQRWNTNLGEGGFLKVGSTRRAIKARQAAFDAPTVITTPEGGAFFDPKKLGTNLDPAAVEPPTYMPKRADLSVLDRVLGNVKAQYTPAVKKTLAADPSRRYWYDMRQLGAAMLDQGADPSVFEKWARLMGPTSSGTTVKSNLKQATYFLGQHLLDNINEADLAAGTLKLPKGFANRRQSTVNSGVRDILFGKGLDPFDQAKQTRYTGNLLGIPGVAIDEMMGRYRLGVPGMMKNAEGVMAPSIGFPTAGGGTVKAAPMKTHYGAIQKEMQGEAARLGMPDFEYQAAGWPSPTDTRPLIHHVNDQIVNTAKAYGISPLEAFTKLYVRPDGIVLPQ